MYTENGFQCISWSNVSIDYLNNSINKLFPGKYVSFFFQRHLAILSIHISMTFSMLCSGLIVAKLKD